MNVLCCYIFLLSFSSPGSSFITSFFCGLVVERGWGWGERRPAVNLWGSQIDFDRVQCDVMCVMRVMPFAEFGEFWLE
jgi:hypothetical protein